MGVSRMVERDGDEPGVCKRLGCVVMAEVRAAMPMRYYDEWQLVARDRTVPDAGKRVGPVFDICGRRRAGRPDESSERGAAAVGRDFDGLQAGRPSERRHQDESGCKDKLRDLHPSAPAKGRRRQFMRLSSLAASRRGFPHRGTNWNTPG